MPSSPVRPRRQPARVASVLVALVAAASFAAPARAADPSITEFRDGFRAEARAAPNAVVYDVTTGPDGNVWFVLDGGDAADGIGRVTPSGTIVEHRLSFEVFTIGTGPGGALYAYGRRAVPGRDAGVGVLAQLATDGTVVRQVDLPEKINAISFAGGPDGRLWFGIDTGFDENPPPLTINIASVAPDLTDLRQYGTGTNGDVEDIVAGPEGKMWFVDDGQYGDNPPPGTARGLGSIDPASGTIRRFTAGLAGLGDDLAVGSDGALWATEPGRPPFDPAVFPGQDLPPEIPGAILRMTPTGGVSRFALPTALGSSDITAGSDGALWFAHPRDRKVGRITTGGAITEFAVPARAQGTGGGAAFVTAGPDGNVWAGVRGGAGVLRVGMAVADTVKPTIGVTTPAAGASYAVGQDVRASYACADGPGGTGLTSCSGTVPFGGRIDTATAGTKTFTVTSRDNAGNTQTSTTSYTVGAATPTGDRTAPKVTLSSPAKGATYTVGQAVTVQFTCADEAGGSGVAACEGTRATGTRLDTSKAGKAVFYARAADKAGNVAVVEAEYTVVAATGAAPAPAPADAATTPLSANALRGSVSRAASALRGVRSRTLARRTTIPVELEAPSSGTGRVVLRTNGRTIGSGTRRFSGDGTKRVTVRLSSAGRRTLRAAAASRRTVVVSLEQRFVDRDGDVARSTKNVRIRP